MNPNYESRGSLSGAGFDLLSRLLELNPARRITAAQALDHDWCGGAPGCAAVSSSSLHYSWTRGLQHLLNPALAVLGFPVYIAYCSIGVSHTCGTHDCPSWHNRMHHTHMVEGHVGAVVWGPQSKRPVQSLAEWQGCRISRII